MAGGRELRQQLHHLRLDCGCFHLHCYGNGVLSVPTICECNYVARVVSDSSSFNYGKRLYHFLFSYYQNLLRHRHSHASQMEIAIRTGCRLLCMQFQLWSSLGPLLRQLYQKSHLSSAKLFDRLYRRVKNIAVHVTNSLLFQFVFVLKVTSLVDFIRCGYRRRDGNISHETVNGVQEESNNLLAHVQVWRHRLWWWKTNGDTLLRVARTHTQPFD